MQSTTTIVSTFLPLSLAIIMFGLGLSLKVQDFTRVLQYPKSAILGLVCQMFILPLFGIMVCYMFKLSYEASIGVMILAASPGGITANLFSHLCKGDIALNLTLTAINSVLAAFSLPILVNLAFSIFSEGDAPAIGLQFKKTIEVFAIVLIPVAIGMYVHKIKPALSQKAEKPVKIFSLLVLLTVIIAAISSQKEQLASSFAQIGLAMLVFNILSLGVGYILPRMLKVSRQEAIAISFEVGIHNSTLAIFIAMNLLGSLPFALPAAVYSIIMFVTAGLFSLWLMKTSKA
jgi:BASS family bile acid:Na+ symporter